MARNPLLSRRAFLKLAAASVGAALAAPAHLPNLQAAQGSDGSTLARPNVIMLLFDTLSARHLSLYGYPRLTTPNIDRFAQRAVVYHNHHVAGNFTTPSTASLFTGVYPFTHRAFNLSGLVAPWVRPQNLFALLADAGYASTVFTHNIYADMLLYLFESFIQQHLPLDRYTLAGRSFYNHLFSKDAINGMKSYDQFLFKREEAHGSLFLSLVNDLQTMHAADLAEAKYANLHPKRLPRLSNTDLYFLLSHVIQGVVEVLEGAIEKSPASTFNEKSPSFTYIHLMPPHAPYEPTVHFRDRFADGWAPTPKKRHRLSTRLDEARLNLLRQEYDEFLLNLDAELGRVFAYLERSGRLQDSYVILTSDHGEMFERGSHGHSTALLFEELIRVPLIIAAPGQTERRDVTAFTSNVDLLPTIMRITAPGVSYSGESSNLPALEGRVLPGLGLETSADLTGERSLYVVEAKRNDAYRPLTKASIALLKEPYKLIYYTGYRDYSGKYELYDLSKDPGELADVYDDQAYRSLSRQLQAEMETRLAAEDLRYRGA